MTRTILLYGLLMAALVGLFKLFELRYLNKSIEIDILFFAVTLTICIVGIWLGLRSDLKLRAYNKTGDKNKICDELGISKRELEIIQLLALGYSNQEISEKLFISIHTVKSHSSNVYAKLDAKRRTEAVLKARNLGLLGDHSLA